MSSLSLFIENILFIQGLRNKYKRLLFNRKHSLKQDPYSLGYGGGYVYV